MEQQSDRPALGRRTRSLGMQIHMRNRERLQLRRNLVLESCFQGHYYSVAHERLGFQIVLGQHAAKSLAESNKLRVAEIGGGCRERHGPGV